MGIKNNPSAFGSLLKRALSNDIDDENYLRELKASIETKNRSLFEKQVGNKISEGLNRILDSNILRELDLQDLQFIIAGYHYISFSQGSWFRFIGSDRDYKHTLLTKMEQTYFQDISSKRVPRESNIFVSNFLRNPIQIQFGGVSSHNGIPHLSHKLWRRLKRFLKSKIDLLKHIAKEPLDDKEINDSKIIIQEFFKNKSSIIFLKDLFQHLQNSLHDEALAELNKRYLDITSNCLNNRLPLKYDAEDENSFQFYKWLLEFFVFSFFSTIWADLEKDKSNIPLFVVVIPFGWKIKATNGSNNGEIVKYASFGGSYYFESNPLNNSQIELLSGYFQLLPRFILSQEYALSRETIEPSVLIFEDVVRQCTCVDVHESRTIDRVNKWRGHLEQCLNYYKNEDIWPPEIKSILSKSVGCSRKYISMLEQLRRIAEDRISKNTRNDPLKPIFIFLYSEPGCGKETIAKLIHLFSFRTEQEDIHKISLKKRIMDDIYTFNMLSPLFSNDSCDIIRQIGKLNPSTIENADELKCMGNEMLRKDPFFNFIVHNSSNIMTHEFEDILFGSMVTGKERLGLFTKAHFTCGSIFLDEFNTMNPDIANRLLRSLSEPFEIDIKNYPNPVKTNLLIIFASNKNKEQLIEAGFNQAVVCRITQNYFTIPPLRERPEDIAVSVNNIIRKYNQNASDDSMIHFIELEALRLICELPWEDNYRGLYGLITDILSDRTKRNISIKSITFEETINALKRRKLLGRINQYSGRIKEISYDPAK